jgi:hypothetical protein
MAPDVLAKFNMRIAKAHAALDEYERDAQAMKRDMADSVISTRQIVEQSRDLLDRVGRTLDRK